MPKLIIDNMPVEVPPGTNVLEAARQVGVVIPHFCYHPALGSVGACRLCAMKFIDGPVKGIQMSCMIPAQDGMVVSTTDGDAAKMRQLVIEWLMINHPHDCPVCDEGGECLLQDFTIAGGHGIRRYKGNKRTFLNQNLGPYIQHEMNRCIECYRCARFYQDYAGGADFGVLGSAGRVYFGRFQEGTLQSPFSGNLVDICPTGVFTDKTARFRARYWDYDIAPSVCPRCSLGCNVAPAARYRELLKTVARRNDQVNGWFICDRGRFSNADVNAPERPRWVLVEGKEQTWEETLELLALRLHNIRMEQGPGSVVLVDSPRLSFEGKLLLERLADLVEGIACHFALKREQEICLKALSLSERAPSQEEVRQADMVAVVGADLLDEGPMMALAVRQAARKGAKVFLVGDVPGEPSKLPFEWKAAATLDAVPFGEAKRPVVICGTKHADAAALEACAATGARLAILLPGPDAFGGALLARDRQALSLEEALESGKAKAVVAFEADLPPEMLERLPLVAAADWLLTGALKRAEVVLPVASYVEMDGTYVNYEGRAQRFKKVMEPGLPIRGLDPDRHPPRKFCKDAPGGELLPSWQALARMTEALGASITTPFEGKWAFLENLDPDCGGRSVL